MGGMVGINDEGGTVVGDVGNVKISIFSTFEVFVYFVDGTFWEIQSGETSTRRQSTERGWEVGKRQNVL